MPHRERSKLALTSTVNGSLMDRAIRHAHFIERLKSSEVRRVVGLLNTTVFPAILERLARTLALESRRGPEATLSSLNRLRVMRKAVRGLLRVGYSKALQSASTGLGEVAVAEAKWQSAIIRQSMGDAIVSLGFDVTTPAPNTVRALVDSRPFQGRYLKDWFNGLRLDTQARIEAAVNIGITTGETTPAIMSRIRGTAGFGFRDGVLNISRRHAATIVRTAATHVSAQAREITYAENDDIVKEILWVSTLDARTSPICQDLDGKRFLPGEGIRPPAHHNCRSTTTPILKSWKELGIPLPEAPAGTRASMNGQVPAATTYGDWIRGQSVKVQNEALGVRKAQLFRSGRVKIDRFVDSRHRPLTTGEVLAREGIPA